MKTDIVGKEKYCDFQRYIINDGNYSITDSYKKYLKLKQNFFRYFYPFHRLLIRKYHINIVLQRIKTLSKGKLIDIGCGEKPFYGYVKDKVQEYIGLDHNESPHDKSKIDVLGTAYSIPFKDDFFDTALLTQVIEHLEEPKKALNEINRVLKKDGILILSWPFLYPVHEAPRDFFRYTKYGMQYLANESNFELIEIEPVSGFWITLYGFVSLYVYTKSNFLYLLLSPILLVLLAITLILNLIDRNSNSLEKWTWNYYAVLKKK